MDEEVGLADIFLDELHKTDNALPVFAKLYRTVFNTENVDYQILARLYRLYGKDILFFAILDCSEIENIDLNQVHKLISYFAKKRLENKYNVLHSISIDKLSDDNFKLLSKKRKIKIGDPFEENK